MPLQLTLTEGVLPKGQEKVAFARLSEAMLKWHGLTGNKAMTPNVIGEYRVLPRNETFSGMQEAPIAIVEWKVPSFAFADREVQLLLDVLVPRRVPPLEVHRLAVGQQILKQPGSGIRGAHR